MDKLAGSYSYSLQLLPVVLGTLFIAASANICASLAWNVQISLLRCLLIIDVYCSGYAAGVDEQADGECCGPVQPHQGY